MWLNDFGALGSVAGGLFEIRSRAEDGSGGIRVGVFGGLEPNNYTTGYLRNVRKAAGYIAIDGGRARRHVLGYVNVKNGSLTERSVLTFTNYLPAGDRFFLYQVGEYDLQGPAGQGKGGLTYLFNNARVTAAPRVELQGNFSRGRSIDVRGISDDILNGRPVSLKAVEGLLYESMGGRVTVEVIRRTHVYAGYSRDKTNRDDEPTGRTLVGGYASDIARTGFDFAASDSKIIRPDGNYHSRYLSIGKQLGDHVYVSGEYTTTLSLVRFSRSDGLIVEMKPHTEQFGATGVINVGRAVSFMVMGERTTFDTAVEHRLLAGISYRFP
jgi:hypothetical protein